MRYVRRRLRAREPESLGRTAAIRRWEDDREVCLNNSAGRAEYQRRKQLAWEDQRGICALLSCRTRMLLNETRFTHGDWGPTGQKRDDRLVNSKGEKNELVHKDCLRAWHEGQSADIVAAVAVATSIAAEQPSLSPSL